MNTCNAKNWINSINNNELVLNIRIKIYELYLNRNCKSIISFINAYHVAVVNFFNKKRKLEALQIFQSKLFQQNKTLYDWKHVKLPFYAHLISLLRVLNLILWSTQLPFSELITFSPLFFCFSVLELEILNAMS